jgi:hypothetical protein
VIQENARRHQEHDQIRADLEMPDSDLAFVVGVGLESVSLYL